MYKQRSVCCFNITVLEHDMIVAQAHPMKDYKPKEEMFGKIVEIKNLAS